MKSRAEQDEIYVNCKMTHKMLDRDVWKARVQLLITTELQNETDLLYSILSVKLKHI